MKLTRRRLHIGHQDTSAFYRESGSGHLYIVPDKLVDRTECVVNSMDYERSWYGRLWKSGKSDPPKVIQSLVNADRAVVLPDGESCDKKILDKKMTQFGKSLKYNAKSRTLFELLRDSSSMGENEVKTELEEFRKLIQGEIKNQKTQLANSVRMNRIPFDVPKDFDVSKDNKESKLETKSSRIEWLYSFCPPNNKGTAFGENMLHSYWDDYGLDCLISNIEQLDAELRKNNSNGREIAEAIYGEILKHHRALRKEYRENNENEDKTRNFVFFLDEVAGYFSRHYKPRSKKRTDKNSADRNAAIKKGACYYREKQIKDAVRAAVLNKIVSALIQEGKLLHYYTSDASTPVLSSDTLSNIQIEEAFKKQLMTSLSWGICRLNYFYNYSGSDIDKTGVDESYDVGGGKKVKFEGDILEEKGENSTSPLNSKIQHSCFPLSMENAQENPSKALLEKDAIEKLQAQTPENYITHFLQELFCTTRAGSSQTELKEKLSGCFPVIISADNNDENDSMPFLLNALMEARESVADLRHNSFHYRKTSLLELAKDKKCDFPVSLELLQRDAMNLQTCFQETIRSSGIAEHYPIDVLQKCLSQDYMRFYLRSPNSFENTNGGISSSLLPSFKKVFARGANLAQSSPKNILHWFKNEDKLANSQDDKKAFQAYRNLLNLFYYHAFLPALHEEKNEGLIADFIQSTKKWNRGLAQGKENSKEYRYEAMPDYDGQGVAAYFIMLQSEQAKQATDQQDNPEPKNYYLSFIQDIAVFAFDGFLQKKLSGFKDTILNPKKQNVTLEESISTLFGSEQNPNIQIQSNFSTKQNSANCADVIAFYPFLRLLDARELNKLQHQFKRYHCSLASRNDASTIKDKPNTLILLEKLEELVALVLFTIPSSIKNELYDKMLESDFKPFVDGNIADYKNLFYQSDGKTAIPRKHIILLGRSGAMGLYQTMFCEDYIVQKAEYTKFAEMSGLGGQQEEGDRNTETSKIEQLQKQLAEQHASLVKKTYSKNTHKGKTYYWMDEKLAQEIEKYKENLETLQNYNNLRRKVTFESLYEIHQIHVEILARLVAFAQDWERDMFFLLTALKSKDLISLKANATLENIFGGNVVRNLAKCLNDDTKKLLIFLLWHKKDGIDVKDFGGRFRVRNSVAHLNHITQKKQKLTYQKTIEGLLNAMRVLLAYDKKRENSVSSSIMELLKKEHHIKLCFAVNLAKSPVELLMKPIASDKITHLKNVKMPSSGIVDRRVLNENQKDWLKNGVSINAKDRNFCIAVEKLMTFSYN